MRLIIIPCFHSNTGQRFFFISRAAAITVSWQNEYFDTHEQIFRGETARAIQHEYDHIQGKLYIDYRLPLQRSLLKINYRRS